MLPRRPDSGGPRLGERLVESLASRAIAQSNRNPAPRTFRQITKPRSFEVVKAVVSVRVSGKCQVVVVLLA